MINESRNIIMYGSMSLTSNRFLTKEQRGDGEFTKNVLSLPNLRREGSVVVDSRVLQKQHTLTTGILGDTYKNTNQLLEELGIGVSKEDRFLHIVRDWKVIADTGSDLGWDFDDDSVNVEYDDEEFLFTGSMKITADVSASAEHKATIINTSIDGVDLSESIGIGDFEFGVYIPDPTFVAYVEIIIGSDESNYIEATLSQQYDDEPISRGWNWFSSAWDLMQETGSVDPNLVGQYVVVSIYYTTDQTDEDSFRVSEIIWQNPESVRNYRCFTSGIPSASRLASIDEVTIDFVCPSGVAEETTPSDFSVTNGVSEIVQEVEFTVGGSYTPDPIVFLNLNSVTSLDKIIITNLLTSDSVTLDETWTAGDKLEIDTATGTVRLNNVEIAYSDVLPSFQIGYNKVSVSNISSSEETASQETQDSDLKGEL